LLALFFVLLLLQEVNAKATLFGASDADFLSKYDALLKNGFTATQQAIGQAAQLVMGGGM
jgi:hypothetical protein